MLVSVRGRDGHLDRMLDAVPTAGASMNPTASRDGRWRVVLEAKRQRQVEEHLRVGRPSISG